MFLPKSRKPEAATARGCLPPSYVSPRMRADPRRLPPLASASRPGRLFLSLPLQERNSFPPGNENN